LHLDGAVQSGLFSIFHGITPLVCEQATT